MRMITLRFITPALIVAIFALTSFASPPLIVTGSDSPTPTQFRKNVAEFEKWGLLDGGTHWQALNLPDGTRVVSWEKPFRSAKTYYVDQRNPQASDSNDGTSQRPFRTINRAAQIVKAGERVLVKAGVYRECVQPLHGGNGPEAMVSYEAEPGATIRGSSVLPSAWQLSSASSSSARIWTLQLPTAQFAADNPFAYENMAEDHVWDKEYWKQFKGTAPYVLKRGLVFRDSKRLRQVIRVEDLAGAVDAYWVGEGGKVLQVRLAGDADPNTALMEATNLKQCFAPAGLGVSYVRVKGFVIEQVGNAFSYPVEAAISPMNGHHWIIEDNTVRQINAVGINLGSIYMRDTMANRGKGADCIIRRNTIADCGTSAICGHSIVNGVIEENVIDHCAWQDDELWYDNGGMKLLVCSNLLVRHNRIRNIMNGPGIWVDWGNSNCRVTQNVISDLSSMFGGVFIEASSKTNWVDHNVIWNIEGNGIYQHDCDNLVVFNNLVGHCTNAGVRMFRCNGREVEGRITTCKRNQVRDNILIDNGRIAFFIDPENTCDHNLIADSKNPDALAAWQKSTGMDAHSRQVSMDATLDGQTIRLQWPDSPSPGAALAEFPGPFPVPMPAGTSLQLFEPPATSKPAHGTP